MVTYIFGQALYEWLLVGTMFAWFVSAFYIQYKYGHILSNKVPFIFFLFGSIMFVALNEIFWKIEALFPWSAYLITGLYLITWVVCIWWVRDRTEDYIEKSNGLVR